MKVLRERSREDWTGVPVPAHRSPKVPVQRRDFHASEKVAVPFRHFFADGKPLPSRPGVP